LGRAEHGGVQARPPSKDSPHTVARVAHKPEGKTEWGRHMPLLWPEAGWWDLPAGDMGCMGGVTAGRH